MNYYIFDRVPGFHPRYSIAVLAVNANDARRYMRNVNRGGVLIRTITSGEVKADMGAVTTAAQLKIRERRELEESVNGAPMVS